jgi:hypothetical protein
MRLRWLLLIGDQHSAKQRLDRLRLAEKRSNETVVVRVPSQEELSSTTLVFVGGVAEARPAPVEDEDVGRNDVPKAGHSAAQRKVDLFSVSGRECLVVQANRIDRSSAYVEAVADSDGNLWRLYWRELSKSGIEICQLRCIGEARNGVAQAHRENRCLIRKHRDRCDLRRRACRRAKPVEPPYRDDDIRVDEHYITGRPPRHRDVCGSHESKVCGVPMQSKSGVSLEIARKVTGEQIGTAIVDHKYVDVRRRVGCDRPQTLDGDLELPEYGYADKSAIRHQLSASALR